jgi:hypothetical protein
MQKESSDFNFIARQYRLDLLLYRELAIKYLLREAIGKSF